MLGAGDIEIKDHLEEVYFSVKIKKKTNPSDNIK